MKLQVNNIVYKYKEDCVDPSSLFTNTQLTKNLVNDLVDLFHSNKNDESIIEKRAEEFVNSKVSELNGLAPDKLTVIKWLIEFTKEEL